MQRDGTETLKLDTDVHDSHRVPDKLVRQDEGNEEEIGNGFDFEEEDVRAHSTRAEDFNFSEFIV